MADNELILKIKAKTDELQRALSGAGGKLRQFISVAQGLSTALAAVGFTALARELVNFGLQIDGARARLAAMAGSAVQATVMVRAIREETNGAVDSFTAANVALNALNYKIAGSPSQIADLAKNILILSNGNIELADSFLYMVSNGVGSIERLNEFGISAADVRKRMDELQAATKGLTRDEAFQQAVMEELARKAGVLGDTLNTTAGKAQRLQGQLQELKVDAASAAVEGIAPLVDALDDFNAAVKASTAEGAQIENVFLLMQKANDMGIKGIAAQFTVAVAEAGNLNDGMALFRERLQQILIDSGAVSTEASRMGDEFSAAAEHGEDIRRAAAAATQETKALGEAAEGAAGKIGKLGDAANMLTPDIFASEGLFSNVTEQIEGQLQGLASVAGTSSKDSFTDEDLKEYAWSRVKQLTDDPKILIPIGLELGMLDSSDIARMQELERLITLAAHGNLSADVFGAGLDAIARGDIGAAKGIKGSMASSPTMNPGGIPSGPGTMMGQLGAIYGGSSGGGASSGGTTGGGTHRVVVDLAGKESVDEILLEGVAKGFEAGIKAGGSTASKAGPPRAF